MQPQFRLPPIANLINNANNQIADLSLLSCEDQTTELNVPSDDVEIDNVGDDFFPPEPRRERSRSRSSPSRDSSRSSRSPPMRSHHRKGK